MRNFRRWKYIILGSVCLLFLLGSGRFSSGAVEKEKVLESIQERWGGGIKANKPTGKNHNISYALIVSGNACLALLGDVLPYMKHSKKKRRASLIVEHYKNCTPRNGKYTPEQIEMKKWLAEEVMGITMRGTGAW